jgi:hypothetical protein
MRSRAFRRSQVYRHMWRRLKEDRNQHYTDLTCPCWHDPKAMARFKEQPKTCSCLDVPKRTCCVRADDTRTSLGRSGRIRCRLGIGGPYVALKTRRTLFDSERRYQQWAVSDNGSTPHLQCGRRVSITRRSTNLF